MLLETRVSFVLSQNCFQINELRSSIECVLFYMPIENRDSYRFANFAHYARAESHKRLSTLALSAGTRQHFSHRSLDEITKYNALSSSVKKIVYESKRRKHICHFHCTCHVHNITVTCTNVNFHLLFS